MNAPHVTVLVCEDDPMCQRSLALVLGSEAHGVGDELRACCAEGVRIPMTDGVESLNLAAAAAILMYMSLAQDGLAR